MTQSVSTQTSAAISDVADIVAEYGPFPNTNAIHGVTFDGNRVWAATGTALLAINPADKTISSSLECICDAGTAFDGTHLYQLAGDRINKIDPANGSILSSIPAPGQGFDSGMTWAEGSLWVGQYRKRNIVEINPETGNIIRTIASDRYVTGVTWVDGEFWHGTWEADESDLRRIDPDTGAVLHRLTMPADMGISGVESDGADLFYCGGGGSGKVRALRRPKMNKSLA